MDDAPSEKLGNTLTERGISAVDFTYQLLVKCRSGFGQHHHLEQVSWPVYG